MNDQPQAAQFSTLFYDQRYLILKTTAKGDQVVIAKVYREQDAQDIEKLLQTQENLKYAS